MICYVCREQATGICTSCGAALCETTELPRATDTLVTQPRRAV